MLPAAVRMRARAEFAAAVRGRRAAVPAVVVHHRHASDAGDVRIGFIVGRGVGTAATRNRVRRRLRHLVRERLTQLAPGTRLVVRATPVAAELSADELGRQLRAALDRAVRTDAHCGGGA